MNNGQKEAGETPAGHPRASLSAGTLRALSLNVPALRDGHRSSTGEPS